MEFSRMEGDGTSPSEVREYVRSVLPEKLFKPTPWLILFPLVNAVILIALMYAAGASHSWLVKVGCAILIGHQMFAIGNFSHYLSHRAILQNKTVCYLFELVLWGMVGSAATVWARAHNFYHHRYTNGKNDTFRAFSQSEASEKRRFVRKFFSPNKEMKYSPLSLLTYYLTHSAYFSGLMNGKHGDVSSVVPYVPDFNKRQKRKIVLEMLVMVTIQVGYLWILDFDVLTYLAVYVIGSVAASGIASIYLFTQHSLFPLDEDNDPIRNSASLYVSAPMDFLHMYVSRHVEHHYFPSMSPIHLHHVTKTLQEKWPHLYTRITFSEVLPDIFDMPIFKQDPIEKNFGGQS
jgi:fatty acid desaturase|tara:strand:+ start:49874 stop:50914 length:1041 start_codon:yes stop_codon:yes gene_type:complete